MPSGPPRVDWDVGKDKPGSEGMLQLVNEYRRVAGVPPVEVDPAFAKGCREHAEYMVLNRGKPQMYSINAHHQDPSLPGATPDGADCAKNAVLYPNVPDLRDAVHGWMASIYHRQPIISPQIERDGIGSNPQPDPGRLAAALRFVYRPADAADFPIEYPADGQREVPIDFRTEAPNPIPPGGSSAPGYPITLLFPPYEPLTDVSATLVDGEGRDVAFYLSWPEKPASKYSAQPGLIGMIPEQTLRAGARYTASITATWRGTQGTWSTAFSTMERVEVDATDEAALIAAVGRPARVRGTVKSATFSTEHSLYLKLQGPPVGSHILSVDVTAWRASVEPEIEPPKNTRYATELVGRTVEVEATPTLMFRTLRLESPPTSTMRVIR